MSINWEVSTKDFELITKTLRRARKLYASVGSEFDALHHRMNLTACHSNGTPLDFERLLTFDDYSFMHDITGIDYSINRSTGKLGHLFVPRCAKFEGAEA